jgi:hypothetical protein
LLIFSLCFVLERRLFGIRSLCTGCLEPDDDELSGLKLSLMLNLWGIRHSLTFNPSNLDLLFVVRPRLDEASLSSAICSCYSCTLLLLRVWLLF